MPLRLYKCESGHEVEAFQRMREPELTTCPHDVDGQRCNASLRPQIQNTSRPIVRNGTPRHSSRSEW